MGIVIDARERFAERRRLAEQEREAKSYPVESDDKHINALRELFGEGDD